MKLIVLAFILLLVSCKPERRTTTEEVKSEPPPVNEPSSEGNVDVPPQLPVSNSKTAVSDSSLYVGEVDTFNETNELYTPVYYHDHLEVEGLYETLSKQTDSLVYEDIERRRSRIPVIIARNHFNLSGLDTLSVYKNGRLV